MWISVPLVFVFFSGHGGIVSGNKDQFDLGGEERLPVQAVTQIIETMNARAVVTCYDMCRTNPGTPVPFGGKPIPGEVVARAASNAVPVPGKVTYQAEPNGIRSDAIIGPRATITLFSCSPAQFSLERSMADNSTHGYFTVALANGLLGAASDGDHGLVTAGRLIDYIEKTVYANVKADTLIAQTPWSFASGTGSLSLTLSEHLSGAVPAGLPPANLGHDPHVLEGFQHFLQHDYKGAIAAFSAPQIPRSELVASQYGLCISKYRLAGRFGYENVTQQPEFEDALNAIVSCVKDLEAQTGPTLINSADAYMMRGNIEYDKFETLLKSGNKTEAMKNYVACVNDDRKAIRKNPAVGLYHLYLSEVLQWGIEQGRPDATTQERDHEACLAKTIGYIGADYEPTGAPWLLAPPNCNSADETWNAQPSKQ